MQDNQSRKWQLTVSNPVEKGLTHEAIIAIMADFKSCVYFCMSDEVGGEEKTYHTHIFIVCSSAVRFTTMKNKFPTAHIEAARGTSEQNKNYIFKEGTKWENDEKGETNLRETHYEYGLIPNERQGARSDLILIYEKIKDGASNTEIMDANPDFLLHIDKIERVRQAIKNDEAKDIWRNVEVVYLWGATGCGKTRFVMELYGYSSVYRAVNYNHPFDEYTGQDVLLFDEFYGNLQIREMLNYLDGYPMTLPARYFNRQANYTKVYIISNSDLKSQYHNVQREHTEIWKAFIRRINKLMFFGADGKQKEYSDVENYVDNPFITIADDTDDDSDIDDNPFKRSISIDDKTIDRGEQQCLTVTAM
ncbi:hypothetical protein FACS189490_04810 [Clostridia bacterium]|nr:hypothetical protein FACS189490_04810 [Clostridia bacterium]